MSGRFSGKIVLITARPAVKVLRNELDIVFLVTKHAWRHLVARGGGSVLLVGSAPRTGSGSTTSVRA